MTPDALLPPFNLKIFNAMNIPTSLAEELKLYLKQQATKGDLEAQTLLAQIEQMVTAPPTTMQQPIDVPLPKGIGLGC